MVWYARSSQGYASRLAARAGNQPATLPMPCERTLAAGFTLCDPHGSTDWNDAGEKDTLPTLRRNLRAMGAESYVEIIRSGSAEAARDWNRPIDLLFIDGDHSYQGVKSDWDLFSPHMAPFGVVVFHDTTWAINDFPFEVREDLGVSRFLEELREAGYPLVTINRDYGVTLVQSTRGGVPLKRLEK